MWLPRGLSGNGASIYLEVWVGYDQGVHSQEIGGSRGSVTLLFHGKTATQNVNVCQRTAMAETQLPEYSGGSGLDNENGLPRGVPRVYKLRLSTGAVERYRRESTCCGGWVILKNCTTYDVVFTLLIAHFPEI